MKKKIFAVCLAVCLLAISIVGGTLAYLTDTHAQLNTFTVGNVGITLSEAEVTKDAAGNLVADGDKRIVDGEKDQNYHLFPGMTVTKDPTITVDESSEDAYIGAKVVIKGDIYGLIGVDGTDLIDINKIAGGGLIGDTLEATTWNGLSGHKTEKCFVHQVPDKANNTWTLYIFILDAKAAKSEIVLFNTLTIPADWDHAEMAKLQGMTIDVTAYATQTNGFTGVYDALTKAFTEDFNP